MVAMAISLLAPVIFGRCWYQVPKGQALFQWWTRRASNIVGLKITLHGRPPDTAALITANHISFLDILVISTTTPAGFLSKEALRFWPILGYISSRSGTVYIKRGKRNVLYKTLQALCDILQSDRSLVIFPEGTTTLGERINKFHTGLFQAAINTNSPVQPVALRYFRHGKLDRIAAYIDQDNFLITLIKIIAQPKTEVQLTYCKMIQNHTHNRRELAAASHSIISQVLSIPASGVGV